MMWAASAWSRRRRAGRERRGSVIDVIGYDDRVPAGGSVTRSVHSAGFLARREPKTAAERPFLGNPKVASRMTRMSNCL